MLSDFNDWNDYETYIINYYKENPSPPPEPLSAKDIQNHVNQTHGRVVITDEDVVYLICKYPGLNIDISKLSWQERGKIAGELAALGVIPGLYLGHDDE